MTFDFQAAAFRQAAQPRTVTDQRRAQYTNEAVLSATPAQLVTMLYDRLLLDLHRAEAAQVAADWEAAREQLLHAQAIVGELSSTLRIDVWDGGEGLLAVYNYASTSLITANVHRDVQATRDCIRILEPLRQSWHEAAARDAHHAAADRGSPRCRLIRPQSCRLSSRTDEPHGRPCSPPWSTTPPGRRPTPRPWPGGRSRPGWDRCRGTWWDGPPGCSPRSGTG